MTQYGIRNTRLTLRKQPDESQELNKWKITCLFYSVLEIKLTRYSNFSDATRKHTHPHTLTHTYTHTHPHTHPQTHTYTQTHTPTHPHPHTHTHTLTACSLRNIHDCTTASLHRPQENSLAMLTLPKWSHVSLRSGARLIGFPYLWTFRRGVMRPSSVSSTQVFWTIISTALRLSETSATVTIWCIFNILVDMNCYRQCREKMKSPTSNSFSKY